MNSIGFTDLQKDAIIELVNMGIGRAASALADMTSTEVVLSVPDIDFILYTDINAQLSRFGNDKARIITQYFNGDFSGNALLVFPETSGKMLVRKILDNRVAEKDIENLQEETLTEVGNILLNACFGQLAELLSSELESDVPTYMCDRFIKAIESCVIKSDSLLSQIMLLQVDFSLSSDENKGFVVFIMDVDSMKAFKQKVEGYLASFF